MLTSSYAPHVPSIYLEVIFEGMYVGTGFYELRSDGLEPGTKTSKGPFAQRKAKEKGKKKNNKCFIIVNERRDD